MCLTAKLYNMKEVLKYYKDFPKEGILFIDIFPLLQSRKVFKEVTDRLSEVVTAPNVAAPEARAFLFASPLLSVKGGVENIIPFRKSGKLPFNPGDLVEIKIEKEYGFDSLFYRKSDIAAGKADGDTIYITLLDDVLATGGTALGIANSIENQTVVKDGKEYKIKIKEFVFIVGINGLKGRERLTAIAPVTTLIDL